MKYGLVASSSVKKKNKLINILSLLSDCYVKVVMLSG